MAYTAEQRDVIFRIWAFEADRSADKAARLAHAHPEADELGIADIEARTIRNWVRDEGWSDRAYRDIFASAPELRFNAQASLALAAPEASRTLRDALGIDCMVTRHFVVRNADGSTEVAAREEFDVNLYKLKVQAAQLVLDRTGFSPVGTRETGQIDAPPAVMSEVLEIASADTPEALAAAEEKLRRKLGVGAAAIGIGQSRKYGG